MPEIGKLRSTWRELETRLWFAGLRAIAKAVESPPAPTGARAGSRPYREGEVGKRFDYALPLTLLSTWQGFIYVAFIIDVFARRIVGWRVSASARTDFVLDALEQAIYERKPEQHNGLIHLSDRGVAVRMNSLYRASS